MKAKAATVAIGLSVLFMVVYNATLYFASQRADVPSWCYDWELMIPFVRWMIVPYMSIDLFFFCAPFLCVTPRELTVHARRIMFCILVAGLIFYIYPLRLVWERTPIDGWLGVIYNPFIAVDIPFNLLPSLHLAFRTVLAEFYARKTSGPVRWMSHVWFSLIGFSTLLIHQHHIVDVIGGFALGAYALYFFPLGDFKLPTVPNPRIALYYALLPLVSLGLIAVLPREGLVLMWPAIAGLIVMLGYVELGPGIYRKAEGRLPWSSRFALGPIRLGQYLSLLYYQRQCRPWDEAAPGVLIGRKLTATEAQAAIAEGVTAVLDLTAEFCEVEPFRKLTYRNIQVLDLTAPTQPQLAEMADFITRESQLGKVYVHCKIGYSRSAAAVGAYLLSSGRASTSAEAAAQLRAVRPSIVVRPEIILALQQFSRAPGNAE